ncbi:THO complex subunit 1 transcription elongation factor-domain-containing protein [Daedaleopsis nitida]|nr:THO complex subunit 1 transcription elongation factor-domain-containing protein [Daedaleopsis nitida]
MQAVEQNLKSLVATLPPQPLEKETLDTLVERTLSQTQANANPESWKNRWEYALRKEIFGLAVTEGTALKNPKTRYYDQLSEMLDVILTFTEHDACDSVFPFMVMQDLLETQTISSCSHIFSWIEARATRLTEGMVPQKGKALVLLRTLNDLLRRLSNMGSTTMFCGRILTFLSRVFPLGERSGVNLRGEYGPAWDGPTVKPPAQETVKEEGDKDQMDVDQTKEEEQYFSLRAEFYYTFWSLQLPFSRPSLFAEPQTMTSFKEAVTRVLPVIKEATAKDRALMGSKSNHATSVPSGPLKRQRETGVVDSSAKSEYYFAKYLTSPELIDLEVADTHFRRQFLFQLLILLHHLLTFTKTVKTTWSTPRNRSLQMDFTLEASDAQWVQETITRATEELRQTAPNGRAFSETVQVILEREKNWVKWKNELCTPFDREPWSEIVEVGGEKRKIGLEEATDEARKKMKMDPEPWPHRYGTASLTEIWEMGYRDLTDLQHPFQPGDVKDFVKKVKQEDARMNMRRQQLTKQAERVVQARAKAAALKDGAAALASANTGLASAAALSAGQQAPAPSTPLHPSLPAKPGSTPAPSDSATASPVRVSTPIPPTAAPGTPTPAPAPAPEPVQIVLPPDAMLDKYEENKQRWAWLALRTGRDQYLQHYGHIGTGDIVLLVQEIEKEKANAALAAAQAVAAAASGGSGSQEEPAAEGEPVRSEEPGENGAVNGGAAQVQKDAEGDVKMEEQ